MRKAASVFFIATLLAVAMLSFVSCKKNSDKKEEDNTPTLVGKWTVDNRVLNEYVNDTLDNTTTEPGDGTTWDFQSNGHVIISYPGSTPENHTYVIQEGSKVNIDGFVFEIRDLTATSVTLFIRHDFALGEYDEVFTNLKK